MEEVRAAEVLVAAGVSGLHAGDVDVDLDGGLFGDLGDGDAAGELGEAAPDLGQAQVAAHELDRAVGRVDGVRPRRGDLAALVGTNQLLRGGGGHEVPPQNLTVW